MLCFFREAIPEFINLHHLTIVPTDYEGFYWRFLPVLLKKTPNLKTLVIEVDHNLASLLTNRNFKSPKCLISTNPPA